MRVETTKLALATVALIFMSLQVTAANEICLSSQKTCFNTIQDAINNANPYEQIRITQSIRIYEQINLNVTGITLLSNTSDNSVIINASSPVLTITRPNITIQNISINATGVAIQINDNNATIFNNLINTTGTTGNYGIYLSSNNLSNSLIHNNTIQTAGIDENYAIRVRGFSHTIKNNVANTSRSTGSYNIAIHSLSSYKNIIENNTLHTGGTDNNYGIYISGSTGNNTIKNNIIRTSGTSSNYGVYFESSFNSTHVQGNNIRTSGSSDTNAGIYLLESSSILLRLNKIFTNGSGDNYGIYLQTRAINNSLIENNISTNGVNGNNLAIHIATDSSNNTILRNNISAGTGDYGFGIYFFADSNNNTVNQNIITSHTNFNYHSGIYFERRNNHNLISNNIIFLTSNNSNAITLINSNHTTIHSNNVKTTGILSHAISFQNEGVQTSEHNIIYNNLFNTSSEHYNSTYQIVTNYFNTTLSEQTNIFGGDYIGGNYYDNSSNSQYSSSYLCDDLNTDGICDSVLNFSTNISDYNALSGPAFATSCTQITTPNTTFNLDRDLSNSATCINILVDNVTINCINHTIMFASSSSGKGIYSNGSNTIIKNCIFYQTNPNVLVNRAVIINNSRAATLINNSFNISSDNSIAIQTINSKDILITGNNFNTSANYTYSINLVYTNNSNVSNNYIVNKGGRNSHAIYSQGSKELLINLNNISTNGSFIDNFAIYINSVTNSTINDNNISAYSDGETIRSGSRGILLESSSNSSIINNHIISDGTNYLNVGLGIVASDYNYIEGNTMATNGTSDNYGINIEQGSTHNHIYDNNIFSSGSISTNIALAIAGESDNNTINSNYFSTRGTTDNYGIYIYDSQEKNEIYNNTIIPNGTSSANYGFYVENSQAQDIQNNTIIIRSGLSHALYFPGAFNSNITGNTIFVYNSTSFVVKLEKSGSDFPINNTFSNNIFNSSGSYINISTDSINYFNRTMQETSNIIGGDDISGNFYANISNPENSYSKTCINTNSDSFCDSSFIHSENNVDYAPLSASASGTISISSTSSSASSGGFATSSGGGMILSCEPNWICTQWSDCVNSIQRRNCNDQASCDSDEIPNTLRRCNMPNEIRPNASVKNVLFDINADFIHQFEKHKKSIISRINLVNFGDPGQTIVNLTYSIIDNAGQILLFQKDSVSVQTREEILKTIDISGLDPGDYTLKVNLTYENQKQPAYATQLVRIPKNSGFNPLLVLLLLPILVSIAAGSIVLRLKNNEPSIYHLLSVDRAKQIETHLKNKNFDKAKYFYQEVCEFYEKLNYSQKAEVKKILEEVFYKWHNKKL